MAVPHRYVKHIDRKELYTSLEARVEYLHSFLDFSRHDTEALIGGSKYIKALIPAVVNIVYKKLLSYDITARAFQTRSTSYEGPLAAEPDEDSPQILHRKMFLRAYLHKMCSDPTQMEFWEYLDKVGMMHVGLGRAHPLHVEYVHIGATLSVIQDVLTEAILSHPRLPLPRKIAIVKALGKVIWIQNDLFAKWYVTDGEEFEGGEVADRLMEKTKEKEGYLHGKKVIDESDDVVAADGPGPAPPAAEDDEGGEGTKTPVGVCPFSGVRAQPAGSVEN